MLGPNEDGAEKYEQYLESLPESPPKICAILKPRSKAGAGRPMLIMARLEGDEISQPFDNEYVVWYAPVDVLKTELETRIRMALNSLWASVDMPHDTYAESAVQAAITECRLTAESVLNAVLQPNSSV